MNVQIAGDPQNYHDNVFTPFASQISPIDEAKALPLLVQEFVNNLDDGLCRRLLADPDALSQLTSGAHCRLQHRTMYAADWHSALRKQMRDHLCYEITDFTPTLHTVPELPKAWGRLMEKWFPAIREARVEALEDAQRLRADLEVEKMVAKFALIRSAVLGSLLHYVATHTPSNHPETSAA